MASQQRTLIYRITHLDNVPWILDHGLHCATGATLDPNFVSIGNPDLIGRRGTRDIPADPRGTLDDYVPFYFCTHSVMLFNVHTGRVQGVTAGQRDIAYIVSSVDQLEGSGVRFLFTDRHAYVANASFFAQVGELDKLDWPLIHGRDFKKDPNRPDKLELRAAELLAHRHVPVTSLLGIACYDDATCRTIRDEVKARGLPLHVAARPEWYF